MSRKGDRHSQYTLRIRKKKFSFKTFSSTVLFYSLNNRCNRRSSQFTFHHGRHYVGTTYSGPRGHRCLEPTYDFYISSDGFQNRQDQQRGDQFIKTPRQFPHNFGTNRQRSLRSLHKSAHQHGNDSIADGPGA